MVDNIVMRHAKKLDEARYFLDRMREIRDALSMLRDDGPDIIRQKNEFNSC